MTNLLTFGTSGFEDGTLGYWVPDQDYDDYITISVDTEHAHSGSRSLKVEFVNPHGNYILRTSELIGSTVTWTYDSAVLVDPTKKYNVGGWRYNPADAPTPSGFWTLDIVCFDADLAFLEEVRVGNSQELHPLTEDDPPGWGQLAKANMTLPELTQYASLYVVGPSPVSYEVGEARWFDDFVFEETVRATAPARRSVRQRQNPMP